MQGLIQGYSLAHLAKHFQISIAAARRIGSHHLDKIEAEARRRAEKVIAAEKAAKAAALARRSAKKPRGRFYTPAEITAKIRKEVAKQLVIEGRRADFVSRSKDPQTWTFAKLAERWGVTPTQAHRIVMKFKSGGYG